MAPFDFFRLKKPIVVFVVVEFGFHCHTLGENSIKALKLIITGNINTTCTEYRVPSPDVQ